MERGLLRPRALLLLKCLYVLRNILCQSSKKAISVSLYFSFCLETLLSYSNVNYRKALFFNYHLIAGNLPEINRHPV